MAHLVISDETTYIRIFVQIFKKKIYTNSLHAILPTHFLMGSFFRQFLKLKVCFF